MLHLALTACRRPPANAIALDHFIFHGRLAPILVCRNDNRAYIIFIPTGSSWRYWNSAQPEEMYLPIRVGYMRSFHGLSTTSNSSSWTVSETQRSTFHRMYGRYIHKIGMVLISRLSINLRQPKRKGNTWNRDNKLAFF